MTTEYYRGYAAGINRCRKPALMLVDAAEKQMKEMEADYVEALKQNIKLKEKLKEARLYWYNQGRFDAIMEMNEEKKDD